MIKYYAVIDNDDRWGPFDSLHEPMALLNQMSRDCGHTDEEAEHFFLNRAMVETIEDEMPEEA